MTSITMVPRHARSFFTGPTAWWQGRERRRALRWMIAIVVKGNTEPFELMFCLLFLLTGANVIGHRGMVFSHPHLDGLMFCSLSLLGLIGLSRRSYTTRAMFAFCGATLRFYGFTYYLSHDPVNPIWCNYAMATVMFSWIFCRVVCRRAAHLATVQRYLHDD